MMHPCHSKILLKWHGGVYVLVIGDLMVWLSAWYLVWYLVTVRPRADVSFVPTRGCDNRQVSAPRPRTGFPSVV